MTAARAAGTFWPVDRFSPCVVRPFTVLLFLCLGCARAQPVAAGPAPAGEFSPAPSGAFVFRLAPTLAQKNPSLDVTVITEMTPAGRGMPAATAASPRFYLTKTVGYHDEGQGFHGERPIPTGVLEARLERALGSAHFLPAAPGHPAAVVMIFVWGASNALDATADPGPALPADTGTPDIGHRALLERAALIGGERFADGLAHALRQQDELQNANVGGISPLEIFESQSFANRRLVEQAQADCFYVVASAYDAAALARGQKVLLWRTKMTTAAQGVAMADVLPRLMVAGEAYFGRDMPGPALLSGPLDPAGRVEVGAPVVMPARADGRP